MKRFVLSLFALALVALPAFAHGGVPAGGTVPGHVPHVPRFPRAPRAFIPRSYYAPPAAAFFTPQSYYAAPPAALFAPAPSYAVDDCGGGVPASAPGYYVPRAPRFPRLFAPGGYGGGGFNLNIGRGQQNIGY